jgi:hypothetical protein
VTPGAAGREADGGTVTADGVQEGGHERLQRGPGGSHSQDNPSAAFTATTLRASERWRHVDRPRPRPSFWQWLFGHRETKKAKARETPILKCSLKAVSKMRSKYRRYAAQAETFAQGSRRLLGNQYPRRSDTLMCHPI